MISISVGFVATPTSALMPSLVVSGLNNGRAEVGATLSAVLSDGQPITSHAWGNTPGGSEYGDTQDLIVPAAAVGGTLYLSAQSAAGLFTIALEVATAAPTETTVIVPGINEIRVESLAPLPASSALAAAPDTDALIVEIS